MSRFTKKGSSTAIVEKRPLYVTALYGLGILAALVLVFSALFTAGGVFGSDDTAANVSLFAVGGWGALVALAVAVWLWRRRGISRR